MRRCKPWISMLLMLVLLVTCCACTQKPDSTAAEIPTTQTTQSTAPTETTQPLAPVWTGYVDAKTEYTYYYKDGRARDWEEDILYFANSMLTEHPMLLNEIWLIRLTNYKTDSGKFYDEALLQKVLAQINALIPQLEELSDEQIINSLKIITALFADVHTRVEHYDTQYFPVMFMPMCEDGQTVFYTVFIPDESEYLLYSQLEAINGYSVEEVIEKMIPYIPCETPWALTYYLAGGGYGREYLSTTVLLEAAGIMETGAGKVVYTFRTADGQTHDLEVKAKKDLTKVSWAGQLIYDAYQVPFTNYGTSNYWLTEDLAEDTLYVRFNSFTVQQDYTYLQLSADINRAYLSRGSYDKVIVDLRCNGGGYGWSGYEGLISLFDRMVCEEFYVLIDSGTYSRATIFAGELMTARGENAHLVGTPCGEAAGFFAGIWSGEYVMPNCGIEFTVPTCYYQPFPAGEENFVIPDILVYPTIEDYKNGVDTILQYVLSQ